jgi:hypothetical protein
VYEPEADAGREQGPPSLPLLADPGAGQLGGWCLFWAGLAFPPLLIVVAVILVIYGWRYLAWVRRIRLDDRGQMP